MRLGAVFPQTELGADVGGVRAYAEAVEGLGFDHLLVYDHVVGADPAVHRGWDGFYDVDDTFHEPMVLFGYLAACTSLELVTGIVILPQRQTVLAAKQAAQVDILTGGRFRFGVGIGWNPVEYEALGQAFAGRGDRLERQVAVLRRLWTERSLTDEVDGERVHGAGIAPLPVQRPIPVWIGGQSRRALERAGRIADGWFPMLPAGGREDPEALAEAVAVVREAAAAAGRDQAAVGMEGRVGFPRDDTDRLADRVARWRELGATHLSVNTMRAGRKGPDEHIAALGQAMEVLQQGG